MRQILMLLHKIFIAPAAIISVLFFGILSFFGNKVLIDFHNRIYGGKLSDEEVIDEFDKLIKMLEHMAIVFWLYMIYLFFI